MLSVDQLSAATLLLYPRYIDPETKELCEIEVTLEGLEKEKIKIETSFVYRNKIKVRNFLSRKGQSVFRLFKG